MNILCIYGNSVYYGHERSNAQVFRLLKDEGFELLVLTNKKGLATEARTVFDDCEINYEAITYPSWSDMRKPFTFFRVLRYVINVIQHNIAFLIKVFRFKPEYIHISNDFMYMSLVPSFLLTRKKIVYRLGDAPVTGWKPFRVLWQRFIVKRTYKFVCISEFIKDKLVTEGRPRTEKDIVIYNFPPVRSKKDFLPIPFIKPETGLVFSYLGQIIDIKGVGLFIEAAVEILRENKNISFLIAGDMNYDKEFSDYLVKRVNEEGVSAKIIFLGQIENIEDFFNKTDVLFTPSIKEEPLGNVLVEAKKYATPSVIFNSGGMPELIKHLEDGFICDDSTAIALEKAMSYYIANEEIISIQGENALKSVKKLGIGFEEYRKRWLSVYK